jgi:hypothetical protein
MFNPINLQRPSNGPIEYMASFGKYKQNDNNQFNVLVRISFVFDPFEYIVKIYNHEMSISKKYPISETLSSEEINSIVKECVSYLMRAIESKVK